MKFVKMHGIGNDYVYVDAVSAPALADRPDLPALARRVSDRHTGVGADGLILVCRPSRMYAGMAHVRMRMFNADGSESEMCGNGIRCVAKFAHDRLGLRHQPLLIETGRGVLSVEPTIAGGKLVQASVDMGAPVLEPDRIPAYAPALTPAGGSEWLIASLGRGTPVSLVSMGNPHAVAFVHDVAAFDLDRLGPAVETDPAFPARINFHVAQAIGRSGGVASECRMRTWERGTGQTLACGTGACAVVVAGVRTGRLAPNTLVHLPGGDLHIAYDPADRGHVVMTGPATDVFEGEWTE